MLGFWGVVPMAANDGYEQKASISEDYIYK
jgi:hypothetical protein